METRYTQLVFMWKLDFIGRQVLWLIWWHSECSHSNTQVYVCMGVCVCVNGEFGRCILIFWKTLHNPDRHCSLTEKKKERVNKIDPCS